MKTEGIKTWRDRITTPTTNQKNLFMSMQAEIDELRAALQEHDAEIEQLRVQLAGCGVAAMQNTESSKAERAKRGDFGWTESYGAVCRMVDREIAQRTVMQQALDALELHATQYPHMQKGYTVDAITALKEAMK